MRKDTQIKSTLTITGGGTWSRVHRGFHVCKPDLVSTLVAVAQQHRLQIAGDIQDGAKIIEEFQNFHMKQSADTGNLTYSGVSGTHDDIFMSCALAVWTGENACHQLEAVKGFDYSGQIHYDDKKF